MVEIDSFLILGLLAFAGACAGFIDTIAGGGGMITLPALLMSGLPPTAAIATNKLQASFGSCSAAWHFIRAGHLDWRALKLPMLMAFLGSLSGVLFLQIIDSTILAKLVPLALLFVGALFLFLPNLGAQETIQKFNSLTFAACFAFPIGFYDGFLGPGTGSFFILALISIAGRSLQTATIQAKLLNATTNITGLAICIISGLIVWLPGLVMAAGQLFGAWLASKLVISKGNALIRPMVIIISLLMSTSLAYKYWF